jgi:sugar phosphate isomerase/epimerase
MAGAASVGAPVQAAGKPFSLCLNTGTMRGFQLPLTEVVDLAAKAGYDALEPWVGDIESHVKAGGTLKDLAARIKDRGLAVVSSIAFFEWVVEDEARRGRGLEEAKRLMDLVRQIGGTRIAAPPAGATEVANLDLLKAAERYRALLELGDQMGVTPQLEIWGFSKCLNRLGAGVFVAAESGHPKACVLADVCHLYRGGSPFSGLGLLSGRAMHVFHMNDVPAGVPPEQMTDDRRLYPGDGVAPLKQVLLDLRAAGFTGALSLELFNRDYWKQDPLLVASTGLRKMKELARGAGG